MKLIRQTLLNFKKGTSDKVYEVDIVETAGEYLVNFRYGKYGANLREGSKTKSPVDLSQATKIADSLLVSKMNKGYVVLSGYDPINKVIVGEEGGAPAEKKSESSGLDRDEQIIQRLNQFIEQKSAKAIDRYTLGRTIWKAGELRIKDAVPVIEKILKDDNVSKEPLDYYSILWAFGRAGDEKLLPLIDKFDKKLPDKTQYMLAEIKMALSAEPAQFIPSHQAIDLAETVLKVSQYDEIEQMSFSTLDDKEREYVHHVLDLHGVKADVESALSQLKIEDALDEHYAYKYLSEASAKIVRDNQAAYPHLEHAIEKLLDEKTRYLTAKKAEKYKPDFDLYLSIVENIDLNAVFKGDETTAGRARLGRLDWIWGNDQGKLKKAVKKTGKAKDIGRLFHRVEEYAEIISGATMEALTDEKVNHLHQILKDADVFDEVIKAVDTLTLKDYRWSFINDHLSLLTRAKYETNIIYELRQLFNHQFETLRVQALKPKNALIEAHQQSVLSLYGQSLVDEGYRAEALLTIKKTPVKSPFTQTFRRLYKIAEFRDDADVLAILNYRVEATKPTPSNYWDDIPKPFAKATKEYFRRRMVRTLRNVAKFQPVAYIDYAKAVLLQADDHDEALAVYSDKKKLFHFPQLAALNFVLHHHSRRFTKNYLGVWQFNERVKESARPEAYPALWDQAEGALLDLLLACQAKMVNDFALAKLSQKTDYIDNISKGDWIKLVQRPYENTAIVALDHLQESLADIEVMTAVLASSFESLRRRALEVLDGESLGENLDLLVLMLLSEHDDVSEFAKSYLYTAQTHYTALSDRLLAELLVVDEAQQANVLNRCEWLLLHPLKAKASLAAITPLLKRPELEYQLLASKLLEASDYSFDELAESYALMSDSEYPEIRAGAIALLAKLSTIEKIKHKDLLFKALLDENANLRQKSRKVIAGIDDQDFRIETFDYVLPTFFKAEPVDGFSDDMLELVVVLEPMHSTVDANVLWRLLNAKSKLAEWVGAIILPARKAAEFSVKQLSMLSKNATFSVREWALDCFEADLSLSTDHFSDAIRILDNRWDDSRERAIEFFQKMFDESFWDSQKTIAVCDNVYPDVQRFGRDLVTRFFNQDQGEEYLIKLSQHPSTNVQLFVSGFLKEYATDQPRIILSLLPYFKTVLSQVNRGRLIKDRVISFLFDEAQKNGEVAKMVADLFSDQSISMVITDKMQYIKTLFKLQTQFTTIKTPVRVIEPEVRAI